MDFLTGSPLATPAGQRIEHATSSSLQSEDWGLNMEICDIVNETEEGPKDAVKAIKKRIVGNKNFREVMLALTVLEACVKNCGHRFHVLVSTRDFVEGVLVRAISPKNNPPLVLHNRVLSLIQAWADAFRSSPSLTGVVSVYEDLRKRGVEFPVTNLDALSPIYTPHRSVPDNGSPVSVPPAPQNLVPGPASPQHALPAQNHEGPISCSPDQLQKLRAELQVVRENLTVMSEMMNQSDPGHAHQSDTELLQQLYTVCKGTQDRVVELIPTVTEEDLIEELLAINDDLNTTFARYQRFERICSGQNTSEQNPAAAYANLIDLSPAPRTLSQPAVVPAPALPVSQPTVGDLSNQMASTRIEDDFDAFAQARSSSMAEQSNGKDPEAVEGLAGTSDTRPQNTEAKNNSPESTILGSSPNFDWMVKKGMIPVSQSSVMDDIEKWLSVDAEEETADNEGVTSEEFDKFLAERAKAADRLPPLRAAAPDAPCPQPRPAPPPEQSRDQLSML